MRSRRTVKYGFGDSLTLALRSSKNAEKEGTGRSRDQDIFQLLGELLGSEAASIFERFRERKLRKSFSAENVSTYCCALIPFPSQRRVYVNCIVSGQGRAVRQEIMDFAKRLGWTDILRPEQRKGLAARCFSCGKLPLDSQLVANVGTCGETFPVNRRLRGSEAV